MKDYFDYGDCSIVIYDEYGVYEIPCSVEEYEEYIAYGSGEYQEIQEMD